MKNDLKTEAISLRKRGLTYSEILAKVPVAKSTLSDWLHSVSLAKHQYQRITEKKLAAMRRGSLKIRNLRLERSSQIINAAAAEAKALIQNPLWLAGTVLYWAEGSKQKTWRPSQRVAFTNTDPATIRIVKVWLEKFANIKDSQMKYDLYIHQTGDVATAKAFWFKNLGISDKNLSVYFKKHNPKPHRKNVGREYYGTVRLAVSASTDLNRRITGWINGLINGII